MDIIKSQSESALLRGRGRRWSLFHRRRQRKSECTAEAELFDFNNNNSISTEMTDLVFLDADSSVRKGCLKKADTSKTEKKEKKSVSWDTFEIYSHEIILGDNPAVSSGPPVSIDWEAFDQQTLSIDDYEKHRANPRVRNEMILPRMVREDLLRNAGYSRGELKEVSEEIAVIRRQRSRSARDAVIKTKLQKLAKASLMRTGIPNLQTSRLATKETDRSLVMENLKLATRNRASKPIFANR